MRKAFTLVELLVVIGIIGVLISLLLPSLNGAQRAAKSVQCKSNLKQVGQALQMYSESNRGVLFPPGLGARSAPSQRWPVHVFKMAYPPTPAPGTEKLDGDATPWRPAIMECPADLQPVYAHSYVLNDHLTIDTVKYSSGMRGVSPTEIVVIGEKKTSETDYYMNINGGGGSTDFDRLVEPFRHGARLGSNYLYLDMHVATASKTAARSGLDPWAVQQATTKP